VRTTIPKYAVGACSSGRYIVGPLRRLNQSWMMSPQTPTTVIQGPLAIFRRRQSGFSPGQYFLAIDSLTTTSCR
jgi:hypothetical protein